MVKTARILVCSTLPFKVLYRLAFRYNGMDAIIIAASVCGRCLPADSIVPSPPILIPGNTSTHLWQSYSPEDCELSGAASERPQL